MRGLRAGGKLAVSGADVIPALSGEGVGDVKEGDGRGEGRGDAEYTELLGEDVLLGSKIDGGLLKIPPLPPPTSLPPFPPPTSLPAPPPPSLPPSLAAEDTG